MSKFKLRLPKPLAVIAACLLAVSMIVVGGATPPTTMADDPPSVSIAPDSQTVLPGESSSVDVVVDSTTAYNVMSCHVEVSYDPVIFTDVTVEEKGLLGTTLILEEPGSGVIDGLVKYGVTRQAGNVPVPVSGPFITISFTVSDTAPVDTYILDVHDSLLLDENLDDIPGVDENDGTVSTGVPGAPDISVDPTVIDFGEVLVDTSSTNTVTISNVGDADLTITGITITGTDADQFSVGTYPGTIAAGGSADVNVTFSPTSEGAKSATLNVASNDPDEATVTVPLSGVGITVVPDILVSPTAIDFGEVTVDSSSAPEMVTVSNEGEADLDIEDITITGAIPVQFSTQNDGCSNETIGPGHSCTLEVVFSPTSEGDKLANLSIPSNDPDEAIVIVPLSGEGVSLVYEVFEGWVAEDERADIPWTIPARATELEINLTTEEASPEPDLDLELYDGTTFVIGWKGLCDSPDETECTYKDDTFAWSGWDGGEEYIRSDGPLGRDYDLKVYGYEAGNYTATVSYVPPGPPNLPPEIEIDVPATVTLGDPVAITVTAEDPDGVAMVMFMVSSPWPEEWRSLAVPQQEYENIIEFVMSFGDEASLTFVPGWAGTYTVEAWACDKATPPSCTPEDVPETETFEVLE